MRTLIATGCALAALAAVPSSASARPALAALSDSGALVAYCAQPTSARNAAAAKRTGPLGWLMRATLSEDEDEPARFGMVMSHYLRSPLLTSFFSIVPCPSDKRADGAEEGRTSCALLVIRGRDGEESLSIDLPVAGATTAAALRGIVSELQTRGEPFLLIQADGELELPAGAIREVRSAGC
jgi:hypothetical protein